MYSSYLNSFTSKVASIRQNILQGEADGDTEDDTYLCRTLRSYYTNEKKSALPAWLPPDPRGPAPVAQPVYNQSVVGAGYGMNSSAGGGGMHGGNGSVGGKADFNSLFGGQMQRPNTASPPPTGSQGLGSLRAGRGLPGQPGNLASRSQASLGQQPLSARDRLKMGRSKPGLVSNNSAGSAGSAGSGGGGYDANYESRFAPGGGGGGGGMGGGDEKPFMAATSPWATSEAEFSGGASSGGRRPVGLPMGGPRRGLPGGPRPGR